MTHRQAVRSQKAARDQACAQLFLGAFVFSEPGLQDSRSGPVGHADLFGRFVLVRKAGKALEPPALVCVGPESVISSVTFMGEVSGIHFRGRLK